MQNEKCKSCFECSETVAVKVRDERGGEWRDSSVRRCANDQCWHIVDGTRQDRLTWISNVYDYKYFGDYELNPEQLAAVYEAQSLALSALVEEKPQPRVAVKKLGWGDEGWGLLAYPGIGEYRIENMGTNWAADRYWLVYAGNVLEKFERLDAAKAAAQADYEQRIRSALVDVPAVESEPVRKIADAINPLRAPDGGWRDQLLGVIHADIENRGRMNPEFQVSVHHRNVVLNAVAVALSSLKGAAR